MLKNVPSIMSPELVRALCEMGHGDRILLADGNYPGKTAAKRCGAEYIRADTLGVAALLEAVLTLIPLDTYIDTPAIVMDADAKEAGLKIPVHDDFKAIVATFDARGADAVGHLERHAFYEKADGCCVIVQTGERAGYANIIVQKGVVK